MSNEEVMKKVRPTAVEMLEALKIYSENMPESISHPVEGDALGAAILAIKAKSLLEKSVADDDEVKVENLLSRLCVAMEIAMWVGSIMQYRRDHPGEIVGGALGANLVKSVEVFGDKLQAEVQAQNIADAFTPKENKLKGDIL